jgi:hypothetical protein
MSVCTHRNIKHALQGSCGLCAPVTQKPACNSSQKGRRVWCANGGADQSHLSGFSTLWTARTSASSHENSIEYSVYRSIIQST